MICISSCDPIDDRDFLPAVKSAEEIAGDINLEVKNITPGSNKIILSVDNGNIVQWEVEGLTSYKTADTIKLTSTGTKDVFCNVVSPGGIIRIKREVEVTVVEGLVSIPLSYLVGSFGDGETWVYASDYGDGLSHWYLSSSTNWEELWWSPLADGTDAENGLEDELLFKITDGVNYLEISPEPGAEPEKSEFEFDADNMTITLKNMNLCDYDYVFVDDVKVYQIKLLNKNELILFQDCAGASKNLGWVWRFKKKGFRY